MSRIDEVFKELKAENKKALIPYISAGDPDIFKTAEIMHSLVAGGANLIEVGVPFSDPAADGETIQEANLRALNKGVSLKMVLRQVELFRENDKKTPIILMTYLNIFERKGFREALFLAKKNGVDAVILVDCPIEGFLDYENDLKEAEIQPILLVAPTTSEERENEIIKKASGFIYFVSLKGITGQNKANSALIRENLYRLKGKTDIPVCIGFGISSPETAKEMAEISDGVVVGSALVKTIYQASIKGENISETAFKFIAAIRKSLDL